MTRLDMLHVILQLRQRDLANALADGHAPWVRDVRYALAETQALLDVETGKKVQGRSAE